MSIDLIEELHAEHREQKELINQQRIDGQRKAEAEAAYYTAKYVTALNLHADGMAVTLVNTIIKGHPDVATKLQRFRAAETVYEADKSAQIACQNRIRLIENQLRTEYWSKS